MIESCARVRSLLHRLAAVTVHAFGWYISPPLGSLLLSLAASLRTGSRARY